MIYTKQEWYTPAEIAVHNTRNDCWVSFNGRVLDLTPWLYLQFRTCKCLRSCSCPNKNWFCGEDCVEYCPCFKRGYPYCDAKRLASMIEAFAGKDISHWFKGEDWVQHMHPVTGLRTTYQPFGHGPTQPVVPSTRWRPMEKMWWMDERFVVGKATAKTRPIRITNSLTSSTVTLEVCSEETIFQIMMRYLPHNSHLLSYTWLYQGRRICSNKTLAENGIVDERERFIDVDLPENCYIPNIMLCYNDDLTQDPYRDDCECHEFSCMTNPGIRCERPKKT